MKLWRPKDPKGIAVIKLTLWTGLFVWMVCTILLAISLARQFAILSQSIEANHFLAYWLVPIWVIFTTLMLVWAVARFANKYLRREAASLAQNVEELSERDVKAVANSRFWHDNRWRVTWGLGGLIALVAAAYWLRFTFHVQWPGYLVIVIYFGILIAVYIAVRKNEKEFLNTWKSERKQ